MTSFAAGTCFQLKDRSGKHHFRIILSGPAGDPPTTVSALVNTARDDNTEYNFVLNPGDHAFIKHKSVVNYGSLLVIPVEHLNAAIKLSEYKDYADQILRWHAPLEQTLLARIIEGALVSKRSEPAMKEELRRRLRGTGPRVSVPTPAIGPTNVPDRDEQ